MLDKSVALDAKLRGYLLAQGGIDTPQLAALRRLAAAHPNSQMQSTPEQGQLLYFLTKLLRTRSALELGVFFGYATLAIALGLPQDGRLIACDISAETTSQAIPQWEAAGVRQKIDLRLVPALTLLDELAKSRTTGEHSFDLVYVDADKANYEHYYDKIIPLLSPGGLLVMDNTLWRGQVADEQLNDDMTLNFRRLNAKIFQDKRVTSCLLPLADGMTLVSKNPGDCTGAKT